MSELKELYTEIGYNFKDLENSSWYLNELSLRSAIEIDNFLLGRNKKFDHTNELTDIINKYQLKDTDTALTIPQFPYLPLWKAMKKRSDKEIRYFSDLALEMKSLYSELNAIKNSPVIRLENLRSFLVDLSKEFSVEQYRYD